MTQAVADPPSTLDYATITTFTYAIGATVNILPPSIFGTNDAGACVRIESARLPSLSYLLVPRFRWIHRNVVVT